jgi:cyclic-di-AMP phosphodiesterase PgpH
MRSDKNKKETTHTRVNYEDHSLKFLDWVDKLGLEKTLVGRIATWVEEKFSLRRFGAVFLFTWVLAYAITFEVREPVDFEVGDLVKFDVISPVSFEMVDEVTTEERRIKAESSVPVIFDFDPTIFETVSGNVYRSFRKMRAEIKASPWPRNPLAYEEKIKDFFINKSEFETALDVPVSDVLFEWLVRNRFNASIENVIIRNLDVWYGEKIAENVDKTIPNSKALILARTVSKSNHGRELSLKRPEILDASNTEAFVLKNMRGWKKSGKDVEYAQDLARHLIYPNLTLNKQEMATRRKAARDSVLPVTVSIKKNQTMLPAGTVIQPFHMALVKEIQTLRSDRRHDIQALTIAFLFLTLIVVFFQYLRRFAFHKVRVQNKDVWVMGVITLVTIFFAKFFLFITETSFISRFGSDLPSEVFLYIMPVAAAPMMVGLLIQSGEVVWLFTTFISLAVGIMTELNFAYMVVTFASGIAAARGVYNCKKRNDIYWAGVRTGAVNAVVIALLLTITRMDQDHFIREISLAVPAGFLAGILSSMITMFVTPFLENIFNYTTDIGLLELSNLNHPLLKKMIVQAPGTYHHSMLVGSMVEAAAEEIGANPLLAKVMSYYHDIGKMEHSNYFIENQKVGNNPHDHISPYMSKTLLIAHVKDGVELGVSYKLGQPIIDGMLQHHGTTLISFFYNKALDLKADSEADVAEDDFRYPGPKPQFREAALCMLADSIEAASRSLDEPTPVRLQNIVRNIVQRKFMEAQLDECSLTLKDLSKVELAFTKILLGIYHQRIDYPRSAGGGTSEAPAKAPFFSVSSTTKIQ